MLERMGFGTRFFPFDQFPSSVQMEISSSREYMPVCPLSSDDILIKMLPLAFRRLQSAKLVTKTV